MNYSTVINNSDIITVTFQKKSCQYCLKWAITHTFTSYGKEHPFQQCVLNKNKVS